MSPRGRVGGQRDTPIGPSSPWIGTEQPAWKPGREHDAVERPAERARRVEVVFVERAALDGAREVRAGVDRQRRAGRQQVGAGVRGDLEAQRGAVEARDRDAVDLEGAAHDRCRCASGSSAEPAPP